MLKNRAMKSELNFAHAASRLLKKGKKFVWDWINFVGIYQRKLFQFDEVKRNELLISMRRLENCFTIIKAIEFGCSKSFAIQKITCISSIDCSEMKENDKWPFYDNLQPFFGNSSQNWASDGHFEVSNRSKFSLVVGHIYGIKMARNHCKTFVYE